MVCLIVRLNIFRFEPIKFRLVIKRILTYSTLNSLSLSAELDYQIRTKFKLVPTSQSSLFFFFFEKATSQSSRVHGLRHIYKRTKDNLDGITELIKHGELLSLLFFFNFIR